MIAQLKGMIKYLTAIFLYYSGFLAIASHLKKISDGRAVPLVLMYHRISDENTKIESMQPGLYVGQKVFENQIKYLLKKYQFISMTEYNNFIKNGQSFPRKSMLITFDDGWRDNYVNAWPVLDKYNLSATIFLTANFIGSEEVFWFQEISTLLTQYSSELKTISDIIKSVLDNYPNSPRAQQLLGENLDILVSDRDQCIEKLKSLDLEIINNIIAETRKLTPLFPINYKDNRLLLNWDEVREMSAGNIGFGSHGLSHRLLTALGHDEIRDELIQSKILIEKKLGKRVHAFSYPNGNYNAEIKTMAEEVGYDCAFIVGKRFANNAKVDRFAIERVGIHNDISIGIRGNFSRAMFAFHLYRKS